MSFSSQRVNDLTSDEWDELVALKDAIKQNPASVHPDKMELFTELFVRTLEGKGDKFNT